MEEAGVRRLIFSSTCATYGMPVRVPIDETHPQDPINPYGRSKLAFEGALRDVARGGKLRAVALRYFNAAGCHPDGSPGRGPRSRGAPHPAGHRRRPGAAAGAHGLRRGLRHARRDLHPRLHPRPGPGPRPRRGPGSAGRRRRLPGLQPGDGDRPIGARGPAARWSASRAARSPAGWGRAGRGILRASWPRRARSVRSWASRPGTRGSTTIVETALRWREAHPRGYAEWPPPRVRPLPAASHHPSSTRC